MTPFEHQRVAALESRLAKLEKMVAGSPLGQGIGVSTSYGALNIRTTQLGFSAVLTSTFRGSPIDGSTTGRVGYSWRQLDITSKTVGSTTYFTNTDSILRPLPIAKFGDKAFERNGNTGLLPGRIVWMEPSPQADGLLFSVDTVFVLATNPVTPADQTDLGKICYSALYTEVNMYSQISNIGIGSLGVGVWLIVIGASSPSSFQASSAAVPAAGQVYHATVIGQAQLAGEPIPRPVVLALAPQAPRVVIANSQAPVVIPPAAFGNPAPLYPTQAQVTLPTQGNWLITCTASVSFTENAAYPQDHLSVGHAFMGYAIVISPPPVFIPANITPFFPGFFELDTSSPTSGVQYLAPFTFIASATAYYSTTRNNDIAILAVGGQASFAPGTTQDPPTGTLNSWQLTAWRLSTYPAPVPF